MIVWHVCGLGKFLRCKQQGYFPAPVRAWKDIHSAERFSKQTGRRIIIRMKFPKDAPKLGGHRGEAVYVSYIIPFKEAAT